jgi:hypothetical protein
VPPNTTEGREIPNTHNIGTASIPRDLRGVNPHLRPNDAHPPPQSPTIGPRDAPNPHPNLERRENPYSRRIIERRDNPYRRPTIERRELEGSLPRKPEGLATVGEIRDQLDLVIREKGFGDLHIFAPTDGSCLHCGGQTLAGQHRISKVRLVYYAGFPYYVQGLEAQVTKTGLAVDHKAGDARRVRCSTDKGEVGGQTFTIIGDLGLVLNYCVVPDANLEWTDAALREVIERHPVGARPTMLHVDCGCYNGRLNAKARALVDTRLETGVAGMDRGAGKATGGDGILVKVLDTFPMMTPVSRQLNLEHPRMKTFCGKFRDAIYVDSGEDMRRLESILRAKFGMNLSPAELKIDRQEFVRHQVGPPLPTCVAVLVVLRAEIVLDQQSRLQAVRNGYSAYNMTPLSPGFPFITKKVRKAILQQCVHILNGCPQSIGAPFFEIEKTNYGSSGEFVTEYQYLGTTSRVEALHSASQRYFTDFNNISSALFDAKALWFITNYNRRILRWHGKTTLPPSVLPDAVPGIVAQAKNTDGILFGFDYSRKVAGETLPDMNGILADLDNPNPDLADLVDSLVGARDQGVEVAVEMAAPQRKKPPVSAPQKISSGWTGQLNSQSWGWQKSTFLRSRQKPLEKSLRL